MKQPFRLRRNLSSRRHFLKTSASVCGALSLNSRSRLAIGEAKGAEPISPTAVVKLFNGKDLSGFYGWLEDTQYEDPLKVFGVRNGAIRISGAVNGYLATEKEYRDYHLVVEYKWGEETRNAKTVRNSGILLHAVGPDGNHKPWMASIECQIAQGCVGDFIVIRGEDAAGETIPVTLTSDTILERDGRTRWRRNGTPVVYSGKQFWWSQHDPDFEELIDTRGRNDVESPLGEWTRVECVCDGDRITNIVNGKTVNECYRVYPTAGKILLESEGFEILFRKFELHPLRKS